jgi:hypothetical protein
VFYLYAAVGVPELSTLGTWGLNHENFSKASLRPASKGRFHESSRRSALAAWNGQDRSQN